MTKCCTHFSPTEGGIGCVGMHSELHFALLQNTHYGNQKCHQIITSIDLPSSLRSSDSEEKCFKKLLQRVMLCTWKGAFSLCSPALTPTRSKHFILSEDPLVLERILSSAKIICLLAIVIVLSLKHEHV